MKNYVDNYWLHFLNIQCNRTLLESSYYSFILFENENFIGYMQYLSRYIRVFPTGTDGGGEGSFPHQPNIYSSSLLEKSSLVDILPNFYSASTKG